MKSFCPREITYSIAALAVTFSDRPETFEGKCWTWTLLTDRLYEAGLTLSISCASLLWHEPCAHRTHLHHRGHLSSLIIAVLTLLCCSLGKHRNIAYLVVRLTYVASLDPEPQNQFSLKVAPSRCLTLT